MCSRIFSSRHLRSAQTHLCSHRTLQARYAMLLQPLVQGAAGTPVAGCGATFSHHQSCHMDPRGFKPLLMEGRDCEEPRAIHLPMSSSPCTARSLVWYFSHTELSLLKHTKHLMLLPFTSSAVPHTKY